MGSGQPCNHKPLKGKQKNIAQHRENYHFIKKKKKKKTKKRRKGGGKYSNLFRQYFVHTKGAKIILFLLTFQIISFLLPHPQWRNWNEIIQRKGYPIQSNYYAIRDPCIFPLFRLGRSEFLSRDMNLSGAALEESNGICTRPIGMENLNYIQVRWQKGRNYMCATHKTVWWKEFWTQQYLNFWWTCILRREFVDDWGLVLLLQTIIPFLNGKQSSPMLSMVYRY